MTLQRLDESWFSTTLSALQVDVARCPPPARRWPLESKPVTVDLRGRNHSSLFDLLNLFLTIDAAQARFARVEVRFSGLGPGEPTLPPPEQWLDSRRKAVAFEQPEMKLASNVYPLVAYCHHYGLFAALARQRGEQTVTLVGISDDLLARLPMYRGAGRYGSRVLGLVPVWDSQTAASFRVGSRRARGPGGRGAGRSPGAGRAAVGNGDVLRSRRELCPSRGQLPGASGDQGRGDGSRGIRDGVRAPENGEVPAANGEPAAANGEGG